MSSLHDVLGNNEATVEFDALAALDSPEPGASPAASSSVLQAARERAQQLQRETTVDLPLPGYSNLVGRYRAISLARAYAGPGGQLRNPMTEWGVGADVLAQALEGLYGVTDAGEQVP